MGGKPTVCRAFVRIEGRLSGKQGEELRERNALADRIAAVLRGRKKVGDRLRINEREYRISVGERVLARHFKLRDESVGHPDESNFEGPSLPAPEGPASAGTQTHAIKKNTD